MEKKEIDVKFIVGIIILLVIFGHSHQYFAKEIDGRLWLNPGSCGRSRFGGDVTMAVMTVENGSWQVEKIVL